MEETDQKYREPPMSQTGINRKEFCAIAGSIGTRVGANDDSNPRIEYRVEPYHSDTTGEIRLYYVEREEPNIIAESVPSRGSGRGITLAGPASDWTVTNDVDDHNIITTLAIEQGHNHAAELFFRGPPAKLTPEGIAIEDDNTYPPLLDD